MSDDPSLMDAINETFGPDGGGPPPEPKSSVERYREEKRRMLARTSPDNDTIRTALSRIALTESGEIRPDDVYGMYILARLARKAGLAPSFRSDEDVLVAMIFGCEVGLSPFQSLSTVAVINGRAALWGDAPLSLVLSKGVVEDFAEGFEGLEDTRGVPVPKWPEHVRAWCRAKRKGLATARETSFSVGDAMAAGLWGKKGPWLQYPLDMLKYKARARAMSIFSDVLRGLRQAEDLDGPGQFDPEEMRVVQEAKTKAERVAEAVRGGVSFGESEPVESDQVDCGGIEEE